MVHYVIALWLAAFLGAAQSPEPQSEVRAGLARAEALYYEAKFKESIDLLLPIDTALQPQAENLRDKISIKLQLALDHIGLNQNQEAKARFAELSALDSNYSLDPQQFSPKVMTLFEEAKAERNQGRCRTFCSEMDQQLARGSLAAIDLTGQSTDLQCPCLAEFASDLAEISYKQGVDAYKRDLFTDALQKFRTALKFEPGHDLAAQYMDLTQSKIRLAADQLLHDWRNNFDAGEYSSAADQYRKLASLDAEGSSTAQLDQMRGAYLKALPPLVESWNRACQSNDQGTMENTRKKATELLPDPAIGQDIVAQMDTCTQKGCLQVESQLAMARLRTRVDPVVTPVIRDFVLRNTTSVQFHVRVRIDEKGDVTVSQIDGGYPVINDAIKTAVEAWKFIPAMVQNEVRCVDTVLPITIRR